MQFHFLALRFWAGVTGVAAGKASRPAAGKQASLKDCPPTSELKLKVQNSGDFQNVKSYLHIVEIEAVPQSTKIDILKCLHLKRCENHKQITVS